MSEHPFYSLRHAWTSFWFEPACIQHVNRCKFAICVVALFWFASFWSEVAVWFGTDGVLTAELSGKLIEYEEQARWQKWSPLWWVTSQGFVYFWIAAGIVISLVAAAGIGGRVTIGLMVFWIISLAHRILWLAGPVEPVLVAFCAYFLISPGSPVFGTRSTTGNDAGRSWHAGTTLRLLQVHCWILLAAGTLMQLASIIWWRGEAVWWLAAADASSILSRETLRDRPMLVNSLTHGFVAIEFTALWLLTTRSARWLGILFGLLTCLAIGLIANQVLYALLLAAGLTAFAVRPSNQESR